VSTAPPFSFAVVSTGAKSRRDWLDLARRTEDLGYEALYLTDHVSQELAPLPALSAAAQVTDRLRLGTYVLAHGLRNPVVLLRELVTVDVLSEGRLDVGVGAGWMAEDYAATGVAMAPGPLRAARLASFVRLLKMAWAGEACEWSDGVLDARVAAHAVAGVQRPAPRLVIGAGGAQMIRLAGREADVVSLAPRARAGDLDQSDTTPEAMDAKVAVLRDAAVGRGSPPAVNLLVFECLVMPRPEAVLEVFARSLGVSPQRVRQMPSVLIGSVPELVDTLRWRQERWGLAHVTVPEPVLEVFAPVIAALRG
jgi:probable F420-dependent oxidoreductase